MSVAEIIEKAPLIRQEEVKNIEECKAISVQVAGTNGKGSTCAFLSSVLQSHGKKVGLYTSPHIKDFCERISINDENINEQDFEKLLSELNNQQKGMCKSDLMFFAAVKYFNVQGVDYSIFETGLGGTKDSATLIYNDYGIITQIGLDHTELLGDTIEKITVEKAGIIKNGMRIYTYPNCTNGIIQQVCNERGAKYKEIKTEAFSFENGRFSYEDYGLSIKDVLLSMKGDFQGYNAMNALLCARDILGDEFDLGSSLKALEGTMVYGRMTVLKENPLVVADVSHNPDGARELCRYVNNKSGRKCAIVSIEKTKNYKSMMNMINSTFDLIIAVCAEGTSRDAKELGGDLVMDTIEQAYQEALDSDMDIIVFCGSFATVRKASALIF